MHDHAAAARGAASGPRPDLDDRAALPAAGEMLLEDDLVWAGAVNGAAHRRDPLPVSLGEENCEFRAIVLKALRDARARLAAGVRGSAWSRCWPRSSRPCRRAVPAPHDPRLPAPGRRSPAAAAAEVPDQHVPAASAAERDRRRAGAAYSPRVRLALSPRAGPGAAQADAGRHSRAEAAVSHGPARHGAHGNPGRRRWWRADPGACRLRRPTAHDGCHRRIGGHWLGAGPTFAARPARPAAGRAPGRARSRQAADRIRAESQVEVTIAPLDITAPGAIAAIEAALAASGGYADVLVNSAGIGLAGGSANSPGGGRPAGRSECARAYGTLAAFSRRHARARPRRILNLASLGGYAPGPYQAAYYASKAYVISLFSEAAGRRDGRRRRAGLRAGAAGAGRTRSTTHAGRRCGLCSSCRSRRPRAWRAPAISASRLVGG